MKKLGQWLIVGAVFYVVAQAVLVLGWILLGVLWGMVSRS